MAKERYLLGVFDDEEILLKAVKSIRSSGVKIKDVMTPFPVHGLDDALGISHTRLHTAGFIFGATGCTLMFLFITWIMTVDYPLIVGGKPYFALPAWIPVIFEVTVLSASVGMVIVYMVRNGLSAIRPAKVLDPRATDDKFIMVFERDEMDDDELEVVTNLLNTNGASEVNEKEIY